MKNKADLSYIVVSVFLTWDVRIVLWLAQSIVKLKTRRKADEIL